MKKVLTLSPFQQKVFNIIQKHEDITVVEIAKKIATNIPKDKRPKSMNNSVTRAIIGINHKYPGLIKGVNYGRNGKVVYIRQHDLANVAKHL